MSTSIANVLLAPTHASEKGDDSWSDGEIALQAKSVVFEMRKKKNKGKLFYKHRKPNKGRLCMREILNALPPSLSARGTHKGITFLCCLCVFSCSIIEAEPYKHIETDLDKLHQHI